MNDQIMVSRDLLERVVAFCEAWPAYGGNELAESLRKTLDRSAADSVCLTSQHTTVGPDELDVILDESVNRNPFAAVLDANRVGMEAARKVKEMLYTAPQANEPIVTSVQHHPSETIDVYKET